MATSNPLTCFRVGMAEKSSSELKRLRIYLREFGKTKYAKVLQCMRFQKQSTKKYYKMQIKKILINSLTKSKLGYQQRKDGSLIQKEEHLENIKYVR